MNKTTILRLRTLIREIEYCYHNKLPIIYYKEIDELTDAQYAMIKKFK